MDQFEEIKSKIDIIQFVSEYLPLKKAGRNFKTLCPFHSEKTPSFIVSPERQIWKCFGCQKAGDIFRFLMEYERMEFGEALRFLAKKAGVVLKTYQPSENEAEKEKLYQINHLAAEFYHYLLLNHQSGKAALDYILGRGITKDSLKLFKIGYSPNLWEGLQKYLVGKKGFSSEDLEKAGLIIKRAGEQESKRVEGFYDRFRNRLMFSLTDHRGNICGFAGRLLDPEAKEAKYVNTPETLIYHKSDLLYPFHLTKEEVKNTNQVLVVEGELDAISSFQIGVKNVVAIKGSALTENQVKLLKRFTENLVLCLDTDIAGDLAARRGIEITDKEGLNIRVVELEKYKDPDEAAQKDPKYYKEKLKEAIPFYDYLIDSAFKRLIGDTSEAKKKIGEELIPALAKIENEIVKDHYVRKLAEKLAVSEEAILGQIKKISSSGMIAKPFVPKIKIARPRSELVEEYFLALCFQGGLINNLSKEKSEDFIHFPAYRRILEILGDFLKERKNFLSSEFSSFLPAELIEIFNNFYLFDLGGKIEDKAWLNSEIEKTKNELKILRIKDLLQEISQKIKKLEKDGKAETKEWEKAQEEFRSLSSELASITRGVGV